MLRTSAMIAVAGLALSGLPGCAVMNEQACLATDWRSVGFEDGVAGRSAGNIGSFRQACAKHGVTPDLAAYQAGHADGVVLYCRAGNGFEVGRRGSHYQGVCPGELESGFLAAYSEGRQLYELESALRSVENRIASRHRRLAELRDGFVSASGEIIADETTEERRAELLINMAAMTKEQIAVAAEIEDLEFERAEREAELFAYRGTLAFAF